MGVIDLRTIYLNFILTDFISLIFIVLLWYQNRKRYDGLHLLVFDFLFQLVCISLVFVRGLIPDFVSIVISNLLGMIAAWFGLLGLERFVGRKSNQLHNVLFLLLFLIVQIYFSSFDQNLTYRNLNIATGYLFFGVQSAWLLLYRTSRKLRPFTLNTGIVFVYLSFVNLVRIVFFFLSETGNEQNYFHASSFESMIAVFYQVTLLLLCFFVVLMINKRLVSDITQEEQKLSIAYHAVPYAIIITRKEDGCIIDVNEGFQQISKYSRDEVIGKNSRELHLWSHNDERDLLVTELQKNGVVKDLEFDFRIKSGDMVVGNLSCINISVDDQDCMLSVITDITEQKRVESEIKKSRDILKKLVVNLQTEHEIEKINLASQIDNTLNQSLAALRINIGTLKKGLKSMGNVVSDELLLLVDGTYNQAGNAIERSLGLMNNMRNEVLHLLGFVEAVTYSVEEIEKKSNVSCRFYCALQKVELDQNKSTVLFNVFQEVLKTILQANQARKLEIVLERKEDVLSLVIIEDGNSFEDYFGRNNDNSPLHVLKEKAALFNGVLDIKKEEINTVISIEMNEKNSMVGWAG
ncbi:MAG: PAS domain S-box protein [Paludibacter sp.]